jgi:hypothetical protein
VRAHLEEALAHPAVHANITATADHDFYTMLADVAAQQRDLDALQRYAPQAEALAGRLGHRLYGAIARRALGVAHRLGGAHAEAQAALEQALAVFEALDTRWQAGRTLFELGELAAAQGRAAEAGTHYAAALAAFDAMRAAPDAARARAALESLL